MTALALAAPVLSLFVLGAHFLRAGDFGFVALSLAVAGLVFVRRPWAARTLQAALLFASAEWLRTTVFFVHVRKSLGQPWTRLAVILGAVALLTALSALVFETSRLRARYGLSRLTRES
jgi:hypothetical protein